MQFIKPDVSTICFGQAASAAAVLLASGTRASASRCPHARILIHQPHGGASGQAVDIEIQAKEIVRMRELLDEILAHHTGQTVEKIAKRHRPRLHHERAEARSTASSTRSSPNRELAAVRRAGRRRAEPPTRIRTGGTTAWRSSVTAATC